MNELLPPGVSQVVAQFLAPIRIYALNEGLDCFCTGQGQSHSAGLLPTVTGLAGRSAPGTPFVVLEESLSPAVGRPVNVTSRLTEKRIQNRTSYANGKPYVYRIDAEDRVEYLDWQSQAAKDSTAAAAREDRTVLTGVSTHSIDPAGFPCSRAFTPGAWTRRRLISILRKGGAWTHVCKRKVRTSRPSAN